MTGTPDIQLRPGERPLPATGSWRVGPADSHASFAARLAGRRVRGRLPLAGRVQIAEPIEESTARLTARTSAVSTGSPVLDRLLAGPAFLDARAYPEISFQSDLLVRVPAGYHCAPKPACILQRHPATGRPATGESTAAGRHNHHAPASPGSRSSGAGRCHTALPRATRTGRQLRDCLPAPAAIIRVPNEPHISTNRVSR